MEALTAASVAALTLYDMCKAVDRGMEIGSVRLLEKKGGRSGHWVADNAGSGEPLRSYKLVTRTTPEERRCRDYAKRAGPC